MAERNPISGMTTRQKVTIALFVIVVLVIVWQAWGLFRGGSTPAPTAPTPTVKRTITATPPGTSQAQRTGAPVVSQQPGVPQPAQLVKADPAATQREMELIKMQQETQAKYIAALNELQMLKVSREIAETNQAIMNAKLASVTAQKGIVDLLAPPVPPVTQATYAQGLATPAPVNQPPAPAPQTIITTPAVNYTVISVSQLQYKWNAVLGYQGSLYSVAVGDVLPPDQSKVIAIDKSGVTLLKDGARKKVSLVPII